MAKDTGFIPALGITEELRDQLEKRDWSKPSDKPSHPDQWTTQECKDKRYSGFRINAFTQMVELWCVGQMRVEKPLRAVQASPATLADMIEEAFYTVGSLISVDLPMKRITHIGKKKR